VITWLNAGNSGTDLLYNPRRFMTHHRWHSKVRHRAAFKMQIAVADATSDSPDKYFVIGWLVDLYSLDAHRTAILAQYRAS
jgi:hypothetical protein